MSGDADLAAWCVANCAAGLCPQETCTCPAGTRAGAPPVGLAATQGAAAAAAAPTGAAAGAAGAAAGSGCRSLVRTATDAWCEANCGGGGRPCPPAVCSCDGKSVATALRTAQTSPPSDAADGEG